MKTHTTADRLKEIMNKRSLKQVDILNLCQPFCKKYGIKLGKNDLSQYVSGKVVPGQDKLSILGMALNVSEVWLMGYEVDHPHSSAASGVQIELTEVEAEHIRRYRYLDESGREFVDTVLNREYDRCAAEKGSLSSVIAS